MLTRDEAFAKVRRAVVAALDGDEEHADSIMAATPDEVIQAVMEGAEAVPMVGDEAVARIMAQILTDGPHLPGHIPGCDGHHESPTQPDVRITLMDDPDAPEQLSQHGLANIANLIRSLITYVATEDVRGFRRWMRERPSDVNPADGRRFSDSVSASMLAWLGLSITNSHEDCAGCPGKGGGGGIPEAFRRAAKADDEVIIDPRLYRHF